jgi:hypothetical protein
MPAAVLFLTLLIVHAPTHTLSLLLQWLLLCTSPCCAPTHPLFSLLQWLRITNELPEIIPRGAVGWERYY